MKRLYYFTAVTAAALCIGLLTSGCGGNGSAESSAAASDKGVELRSSVPSEQSRPDESKPEESRPEESSAAQNSGTGVYLWDKSRKTPTYIEYRRGGFIHDIRNQEAVSKFFDKLSAIEIGEETDELSAEYNDTITYYNVDTEEQESIVLNGDCLLKDDKIYRLIGAEALPEMYDELTFYDEPTPPHFRPYSPEDPDNSLPQNIIPPEENEIAEDPDTGVRYVKDQLIVVLTDLNYSEMLYEIEYNEGAEVIGCVDAERKYQLRFDEEKTRQQLEESAARISQLDHVESVSLYYV